MFRNTNGGDSDCFLTFFFSLHLKALFTVAISYKENCSVSKELFLFKLMQETPCTMIRYIYLCIFFSPLKGGSRLFGSFFLVLLPNKIQVCGFRQRVFSRALSYTGGSPVILVICGGRNFQCWP